MTVTAMYDVQRSLSTSQNIPIVGPLIASPIKAVISTAQLISAIAATVFLGSLAVVTWDETLRILTFEAIAHCGLGLIGLIYSLSNIITLGIVAYKIEGPHECFKNDFHRI